MGVRVDIRWGQDDGADVVEDQHIVVTRGDLEQALTDAGQLAADATGHKAGTESSEPAVFIGPGDDTVRREIPVPDFARTERKS